MITRFFLFTILFFFSHISFANAEVKIPELVGRAMFEGSVQPTESQKENLIAALRNLEKENKVQMGVLVVDTIKPYSIEEYSIMVAEKWNIGQKGVDNGVLMVVATKDRKARLEVGNGLQGSLTDAMTKRIQMEKMVPEFKKGQFVEGIIATVEGIKMATVVEVPVIINALEVKKTQAASEGMSPGTLFLLIFGGFAGIGGIVTYFVVKNSKEKEAARKRRDADLAEYNRRQSEYNRRQTEAAIAARNPPTPAENEHAQRMEARRRREAEYARQNAASAPSLAKKSSSSSSSTKKESSSSSSSSSGYSGYGGYSSSSNNDDDSRKSSYTPPSTSSSNDDSISGGGSFSGGGSSSEW